MLFYLINLSTWRLSIQYLHYFDEIPSGLLLLFLIFYSVCVYKERKLNWTPVGRWVEYPPAPPHCALHLHKPWRRTPSAPSVWACGSVWALPAAWAGRSVPTLPSDGCRVPSAAAPAGSPARTAGTLPSPSWWSLTGPSPETSGVGEWGQFLAFIVQDSLSVTLFIQHNKWIPN